MVNIKNNIQKTNKINTHCDVCNGIGMVKNDNLYCVNCDSSRCEFTTNMSNDEFYKYKYCEFCVSHNPSDTSPKTHCTKCLGEGYYLNEVIMCNSCKFPHRVCNCAIKPYDECSKCYGSGTIE